MIYNIVFTLSLFILHVVGGENCKLSGYTSKCVLEIFDEHVNVTSVINHCHLPVDVTFYISFQYKNLRENKWEYTFVTTNQNEKILIEGLIFPNAGNAPVYLYVAVPMDEIQHRNDSFITIEASLIAQMKDISESIEFLNHTIYIQTREDCALKKPPENELLPWIIGGVLLLTFVLAGIIGFCCWYNRQKVSLDELALVSSLGTQLPGSQPYQMSEVNNKPSEPDITGTEPVDQTTTKQNAQRVDNPIPVNSQVKSGKRGFRFGRLKEEDPDEMRERAVAVCDKSVVIGNPIILRDKKSKKKGDPSIIVNKSVKSRKSLSENNVPNGKNSLATERDTCGIQNNLEVEHSTIEEQKSISARQNSSDSHNSSSTANSETKLSNTFVERNSAESNYHPLEDRMDDCQATSQGARPKLKRTQSSDNTSLNNDSSLSHSVQVSA